MPTKISPLDHDQQELFDDYPVSLRSRLNQMAEKATDECWTTIMQGLLERENKLRSDEFNTGVAAGIREERGRVVKFIRTLAARHFLANDSSCELASRYKDMAKRIESGENLPDGL